MLFTQYFSNKNQKDSFRFILILLLSVVFISGCNSKHKKSAMQLSANSATGQESYQITLWQGGGFTGLTTGFTLSSAGEVTHWQRFPGQPDSALWVMKGYSSGIKRLRNQLEESGALEMKYAETGNMTAGINYETKGEKYIWTWNHTGVENDVPEPLRTWFQNAMDFCQSLQHKN
ncbi:MAG: hypothetical protein JSW07_06740 [bacterium]|nr:MAG: hypothetical protein JSW07_06740 [bacterium]